MSEDGCLGVFLDVRCRVLMIDVLMKGGCVVSSL